MFVTLKKFAKRFLGNYIKHTKAYEFISSPEYYCELQDLLHISKVEGFDLVRIGSKHDGGYILLDDFHEGSIAYSFGISNEVSWDKDMASRGYDVFMYDHTIDGLPEDNHRFHWKKLGLSDGRTHNGRLKTLDKLITLNHHEDKRNMILKMDVEGAEWGFLDGVSSETLSQFSQMTFEFHGIPDHDEPELVLSALRKLNKTHKLIHIHANNVGRYIAFGNKKFCSHLEMTYVIKNRYSFIDDYDVDLPLSLDSPNLTSVAEFELGRWNEHVDIGVRALVLINADVEARPKTRVILF